MRAKFPNYLRLRRDTAFRDRLTKRTKILDEIRSFFKAKDFLEVETPQLVKLPGMEPYLDVFKTEFQSIEGKASDMYLITSPEYAMKKLLVGGLPRIFQMTKCFRNKETGGDLHNPEFTMIEWYRVESDYRDIMRDCEELLAHLAVALYGKKCFQYQGKSIDVSGEFEKMRVFEAFEKYADISREVFENENLLVEEARHRGYSIGEGTYDDAFYIIFLNEIEEKLGFDRPTILYEYPASMAALSRVCANNPKYAERFELYVAGMEIANAFSELTDPQEQLARLEQERRQREELGKPLYEVDMSFIEALRAGMPPSSGIALGVDRFVMLLLDASKIEDVVFFSFLDL